YWDDWLQQRRSVGQELAPVEIRAAARKLLCQALVNHLVRQSLAGRACQQAEKQNITERRRAQDAMAESERRYRSLFENMLEGFAYCEMLFDDRGRPIDFVY